MEVAALRLEALRVGCRSAAAHLPVLDGWALQSRLELQGPSLKQGGACEPRFTTVDSSDGTATTAVEPEVAGRRASGAPCPMRDQEHHHGALEPLRTGSTCARRPTFGLRLGRELEAL